MKITEIKIVPMLAMPIMGLLMMCATDGGIGAFLGGVVLAIFMNMLAHALGVLK